jgi:hypothetical protein
MTAHRRVATAATALAAALWAGPAGIRPRPDQSDYPARTTSAEGTVIAADLLSADDVKNAFATDLNRGWLVVEVAVYPPAKGRAEVEKTDFWLQLSGSGQRVALRPADARTIAGVLAREDRPRDDSGVTLYPGVEIGYGSGPAGYDPVTGTRRGGGWYSGIGVGVGVGRQDGPQAASTPKDRETMESELSDKAFSGGSLTEASAGFLYFPLPAKKLKKPGYELEYHSPAGVRRIELR